jgi:hypothetical protein
LVHVFSSSAASGEAPALTGKESPLAPGRGRWSSGG